MTMKASTVQIEGSGTRHRFRSPCCDPCATAVLCLIPHAEAALMGLSCLCGHASCRLHERVSPCGCIRAMAIGHRDKAATVRTCPRQSSPFAQLSKRNLRPWRLVRRALTGASRPAVAGCQGETDHQREYDTSKQNENPAIGHDARGERQNDRREECRGERYDLENRHRKPGDEAVARCA